MELTEKEWCDYFVHGEIFSALPLMLEAIGETVSGLYDMKYCEKGRWWYGDWEGDRRKVITVYSPKGITKFMIWGWNYNYIPRPTNTGMLKYARTEKAFRVDAEDNYMYHTDFAAHDASRLEYYNLYEFPIYTSNTDIAREYMKSVCGRNAPFIKEFFERTKTDEDIIAHLDKCLAVPSPFFMRNEKYVKAFILAKNGRLEEAERLISYNYYENGYCPGKILAKLRDVSGEKTASHKSL